MTTVKKALIHIDYTNDFVAADGALTCGEPAQALEPRLAELTEQFIADGDYVVFAIDLHRKDDALHPETKLFPLHNIEGTDGRKLYGRLETIYQTNKDAEHVVWMDKTRYSAFAGTELELQLRARGITELHLVGVCTDICVLHTAVDAYNRGYRIVVHGDAVASFDPQGHEWALRHFKGSLGAVVTVKGGD